MKSKNKYKRNKRYTTKIKGGAMLAASMASKFAPGLLPKEEKDSFIVKMIKYSTKVLSTVVTMLFSLPSRNLDELIPPKECKKYASNDYICSEPLLNTLLFGTKADHKKILLDKDDCLQYDDKGNKIVSCKITGGYNPFIKDPDDNDKNEEDEKKNEKKKMTSAWFLKAKLDDLNMKLMQINLYLRKYKYPKGKIKELIEKIKDKELLQNMLDLCNDLLGKDIYNDSYGYRERGLKCDKDLMDISDKLEMNVKLNVKPDAKHIHFFSKYKNPTRKIKGGAMFAPMALRMAGKALTSKTGQKIAKSALQFASNQAMSQIPGGSSGMDLSKLAGMAGMDPSKLAGQFLGPTKSNNKIEEQEPPCETCDGSPMFYAFGKYSSLLSDSILGRKDSLDYILINMIHEFASIKDNPIGKKIIEILKNIECRSNLRQVIQDQINSLDSKDLIHSKQSNDKLSIAIKSYMEKSKNTITQLKLVTNALTSKPRAITKPKELIKSDKVNETKTTEPRTIPKAKELIKSDKVNETKTTEPRAITKPKELIKSDKVKEPKLGDIETRHFSTYRERVEKSNKCVDYNELMKCLKTKGKETNICQNMRMQAKRFSIDTKRLVNDEIYSRKKKEDITQHNLNNKCPKM